MAITTLKTRLQTAKTSRVPMLTTKAGATVRERGTTWQRKREVILLGSHCFCVLCKTAAATEVDHITPLEQGGSNDESNLQGLCHECHAAKTTQEQRARFKGY
jgi:5-methylcytosine-specific restriction protein A